MQGGYFDNVEFQAAMNALSNDKSLPISTKLKVTRLRVRLMEEAKLYFSTKIAMLEEASERTSNGEVIKHGDEHGNIQYKIREEMMGELQAKVRELEFSPVLENHKPISVLELGNCENMSSDNIGVLVQAGILSLPEEQTDMTGAPPDAKPLRSL